MFHIRCMKCALWLHKICNKNNEVSSLPSLSSLPLALSVFLFVSASQITQLEDGQGPVLMTTVAMPVFSTKNETVSSHTVMQNSQHIHCLVIPKLDVSNEITA